MINIIRESCVSFDFPSDSELRFNRRKLIKFFIKKLRLVRDGIGSFRFLRFPVMLKDTKRMQDMGVYHPGSVEDCIVTEVEYL